MAARELAHPPKLARGRGRMVPRGQFSGGDKITPDSLDPENRQVTGMFNSAQHTGPSITTTIDFEELADPQGLPTLRKHPEKFKRIKPTKKNGKYD